MKQLGAAVLCASTLHLLSARVDAHRHDSGDKRILDLERLQDVTDQLRHRLEILERVLLTIVEHNPLVMSVETLAGRSGPFVITADKQFVQSLNERS